MYNPAERTPYERGRGAMARVCGGNQGGKTEGFPRPSRGARTCQSGCRVSTQSSLEFISRHSEIGTAMTLVANSGGNLVNEKSSIKSSQIREQVFTPVSILQHLLYMLAICFRLWFWRGPSIGVTPSTL